MLRYPVGWYGVCGAAWYGALSCLVPTVVPCLSYITVSRGIPDAALGRYLRLVPGLTLGLGTMVGDAG